MDRFRTKRLWAERLAPSHLGELIALHSDAKVMATLGGIRDVSSTERYLTTNLRHWGRYGFGLWIFRDASGQFVGRGGIRHLEIEGEDEIELAYSLAASFWGQGLATEMARGSMNIAFTELELPELVAISLTTNLASRRVIEKMAFRFEREVLQAGHPCVLYSLDQASYSNLK